MVYVPHVAEIIYQQMVCMFCIVESGTSLNIHNDKFSLDI